MEEAVEDKLYTNLQGAHDVSETFTCITCGKDKPVSALARHAEEGDYCTECEGTEAIGESVNKIVVKNATGKEVIVKKGDIIKVKGRSSWPVKVITPGKFGGRLIGKVVRTGQPCRLTSDEVVSVIKQG